MLLRVWLNPPADVVDGDVPQLLVHGGLTLLAGMGADGGLRVLVGHMDFYLAAAFKGQFGQNCKVKIQVKYWKARRSLRMKLLPGVYWLWYL